LPDEYLGARNAGVDESVEAPRLFNRILRWGAERTLSTQFLIASSLVILIATVSAGYLTTRLVADKALSGKAGTTALLVQSLTEAEVQELGASTRLKAASIAHLGALFGDPDLHARFPHIEIWAPDGTVA